MANKHKKKIFANNETEIIDENQNKKVEVVNDVVTEDSQDTTDLKTGVINYYKVNLRSEPSLDSEILDVLEKDTKISIEENEEYGEFYKVTINDKTGYCIKECVDVTE